MQRSETTQSMFSFRGRSKSSLHSPPRPSTFSTGSGRSNRRLPDIYGRPFADPSQWISSDSSVSNEPEWLADMMNDIKLALRSELRSFKDTFTHEALGALTTELQYFREILLPSRICGLDVASEGCMGRPEKSHMLQPSSVHSTCAEDEHGNARTNGVHTCDDLMHCDSSNGHIPVGFCPKALTLAITGVHAGVADEENALEKSLQCLGKSPDLSPRSLQCLEKTPDMPPQEKDNHVRKPDRGRHVVVSSGNSFKIVDDSENEHSGERKRASELKRSMTHGRTWFEKAFQTTGHVDRCACAGRVWAVLEDPQSGTMGWIYSRCMFSLIILSVVSVFLQRSQDFFLHGTLDMAVDAFFETVFASELVIRFVCCPNRWAFCLNPYNQIDFAAVAVALWFAVSLVSGTSSHDTPNTTSEVIDCLRVVTRMLKMLGRFENFHLMVSAMMVVHEALIFHAFMMLTIAIVFTMLIFLVEPPGSITMPKALWLTVVTMTTVGYGDVTTQSTAGNFISGLLMVGSTFYMAVPVGIVGTVFSRIWDERFRLLLMRKCRDYIIKSGYAPNDLPDFFRTYSKSSKSHCCEVDMDGFKQMLKDMKLGLDDQGIEDLFNALDYDRSGLIDDSEFVQALFPQHFRGIYGISSVAANHFASLGRTPSNSST